eukprot:symbB.v1.2.024982.t1/scaffold2400.1/size80086/7
MLWLWAVLAVQIAQSAEYKAAHTVAANGNIESFHSGPGYVRRESRFSQDASFVHQEPVSKVVVNAAEAVSNLTVKSGGEQSVTVWKDQEKEAATAMSLSLLASIGFVLSIFYMVSSSNNVLQVATWKILAASISLFSVILLFMVMKKGWKTMMGSSESDEAKLISDVLSVLRFLFLLILVPFLLKKTAEKESLNQAIRIAGVHLVGFAGADAFTDILKQQVFISSPYYYFFGVIGICLLLGLIQWASTSEGEPAPAAEAPAADAAATGASSSPGWTNLAEAMELETNAFVVGFLLSMWIRFCITGAVPGARYGRKVTGDDVNWLFCFVLLTFFSAAAVAKFLLPTAENLQPTLQRLLRTLSAVLWMTFGWLVFYLSQWLLWNFTADDDDANGAHHMHHTAKLIAANGLAMGSVLVFFPMIMGHLLKRSSWMTSPTFVNFASLVLAFSWETAVYTAVQGASETAVALIHLVIILAVILPGWYFYMLPFARAEAKEEAKEAKDADEAAGETQPSEATS